MSSIQTDEINSAYEDVRNDKTNTKWLTCRIDGKKIVLGRTGEDYNELLQEFSDSDRVFAFVRMIMGDELSKRAKFAFITWTGRDSTVMQKAQMGASKSKVKTVIASFAAEIMADNLEEVSLEVVKERLQKAGGANYGTGVRD